MTAVAFPATVRFEPSSDFTYAGSPSDLAKVERYL
jgi:hypothetical protein